MDYRFIVAGMDVHKKKIVIAVLFPDMDRVTEMLTIDNTPEAIEKMVRRITAKGPTVFCYEAGPCGYTVHRQITAMGFTCEVIAPALTPRKPGDRVKTDRRDAQKLARYLRAGELTVIRIPTREEEAVRDLVRVREDALSDLTRARHRLTKFLLRQGRIYQETKNWGVSHRAWLQKQRFDLPSSQTTLETYIHYVEEAEENLAEMNRQVEELAKRPRYETPVRFLRCLKGIDTLSALTLVAEIQDFERFGKAPGFMAFTGLVASEYSSGERVIRGEITRMGNAHIRRVLVEAAWHARQPHTLSHILAGRRRGCPPEVVSIARRAQRRLHRKYWRLMQRGKRPQVAVVACARELAGFIWAISRHFPILAAA